MKINRKSFFYVFLLLGISLITAGILFNPSFVAKHVKGASALSPKTAVKVIHYQLYAITSGFIILLMSIFYYNKRTFKYFEYPLFGIQKQGGWRIYGIDLPDTVLEKIYYKNAEKILFHKSRKSSASKFQKKGVLASPTE